MAVNTASKPAVVETGVLDQRARRRVIRAGRGDRGKSYVVAHIETRQVRGPAERLIDQRELLVRAAGGVVFGGSNGDGPPAKSGFTCGPPSPLTSA